MSTTLLKLQALQAQRPDAVQQVNDADAALDKANAAVRQCGVDFQRINGQIPPLAAKLTRDEGVAYKRYIADPTLDSGELAAPLAAQRLTLDFIRGAATHLADEMIPLANVAVRAADLELAVPQSAQANLDFEIVQADLIDKVAPASDSQGQVNVSSTALNEARTRAAVASERVVQCRQALKDEVARMEERKRQRASRGVVNWSNPS